MNARAYAIAICLIFFWMYVGTKDDAELPKHQPVNPAGQ